MWWAHCKYVEISVAAFWIKHPAKKSNSCKNFYYFRFFCQFFICRRISTNNSQQYNEEYSDSIPSTSPEGQNDSSSCSSAPSEVNNPLLCSKEISWQKHVFIFSLQFIVRFFEYLKTLRFFGHFSSNKRLKWKKI